MIPTRIELPSLRVGAAIVPVGLEADGAMAAPADPDTVGWYMLGSDLGGAGNVVLAGHVDWGGRLRTFGQLRQLQAGDEVRVADVAGVWHTYRVTWSRLVSAFETDLEAIFGTGRGQELTLITCGGAFDVVSREYLGRLIVRAVREA